jgi:hypothetical protein
MIRACKIIAGPFSIAVISSALCFGSCPVNHIILSGHVEDAPEKGSVNVQLVYAKVGAADTAELSLDGARFRVEVPFLTQNRGPVLDGLGGKCKRKPETVVVRLIEGEREQEGVSLDFPGDFVKSDSTSYVLKSEIVLHGKSAGVR